MLIRVRVKTGMRKESVRKTAQDRFDISVREKAELNAANSRIIALMAVQYRVPAKRVRIMSGHHSSSKKLEIFEK